MTFKIAFASCAKVQDVPSQPIWRQIAQHEPDLLLLTGDTIYLRNDYHDEVGALARDLESRYAAQFAEPNFAALLADMREHGKPVLAAYDDHDFIGNDRVGDDAPRALSEVSRQVFVRYLSPPRTGLDVYSRSTFGQLVDVIILDTRFYRTRLAPFRQARDAVLGADQWQWFEREARRVPSRFLIVVSAFPFHHKFFDSWQTYEAACDRMVALLRARPGVVLVTGDIHANAVCDDSGLIEIVSSGVARRDLITQDLQANYGLLTLTGQQMRVELVSRVARQRADFTVARDDWALPGWVKDAMSAR
ncbi:MAG: alkaline phosphatase D family protein [Burkholderiaceae bacterium]